MVVLPCVPATTIEVCPGIKYSSSSCGIEQYGIFSSRMYSTSALPREMALPINAQGRARASDFLRGTFVPVNPERIEKRGRGRIDVDVRAGDVEAALLQHAGDGAMAEPAMPRR